MIADGIPVVDIAETLGVSRMTLRRYCGVEIDTAALTVRAGHLQHKGVVLSLDRDRSREVLDAVHAIKAQLAAQFAAQNVRLDRLEREREHGPIILRKLTELDRLVRGTPGLAKVVDQDALGQARQLPDRVNPKRAQTLFSFGANAPNASDRQRAQE